MRIGVWLLRTCVALFFVWCGIAYCDTVFPVSGNGLDEALEAASYYGGDVRILGEYIATNAMVLSGKVRIVGGHYCLKASGIHDDDFFRLDSDARIVLDSLTVDGEDSTNLCAIIGTGCAILTNGTSFSGFGAGSARMSGAGRLEVSSGCVLDGIALYENASLCVSGGAVSNVMMHGESVVEFESGVLSHVVLYDNAILRLRTKSGISGIDAVGVDSCVDVAQCAEAKVGETVALPFINGNSVSIENFKAPEKRQVFVSQSVDGMVYLAFSTYFPDLQPPNIMSIAKIREGDESVVEVTISNAVEGCRYLLVGSAILNESTAKETCDSAIASDGILKLTCRNPSLRFFQVVLSIEK